MDSFFCSEVVLRAYMDGYFPMADSHIGDIYWHSPDPRAIFPLYNIAPSRKTKKQIEKQNFTYSINTYFSEVIKYCANRSDTWINDDIINTYIDLFDNGYAHSVEVYQEKELVGGLYGISIRGAFFGESMFNFVPNASKAAFYYLVEHLKNKGFMLLDSQYINDFTEQLGAIEISKKQYLYLLKKALEVETRFV